MQPRAPQTQTPAVREIGFYRMAALMKTNAAKPDSVGVRQFDSKPARGRQPVGHDPFAASLIDWRHGAVNDHHVQAALARPQLQPQVPPGRRR